jgi:Tol biopolymer transport system component
VPNHTNHVQDVYLHDLTGNPNLLISVCADGSPAAVGFSGSPVVSGDGRFVAFISTVPNLLPGQVSTNANVYLRDIQAGTTSLVSVSTNGVSPASGDCFDPVLSRDGRYVAFASGALNLAPGIAGGVNTFWRDTRSRVTMLLPGPTYYPYAASMSSDGRYVAYCGVSGSQAQLRVRDTQLGKDIYTNTAAVTAAALSPTGKRLLYKVSVTVTVSDLPAGTAVISFSSPVSAWSSAAWSADGRFLTYVAGTNAASTNLYFCDLSTRAVTLVSSNYLPIGAATGGSDSPVVSGDGRFVAYRSYATNIIPGNADPAPNIYLFDFVGRTNTLVTSGQAGSGPVLYDSKPIVSASGSAVVFLSLGSGLVANDLNRVPDAFASAVDASVPLDSDGDGIPDWWMALYFGHALAQSGDLSRAQDDADGDGFNNWQEWIAGTDPMDAASALRLRLAALTTSGVTLTWQSVNGVSYLLQRGSDLGSQPAFLSIQSNIVGHVGTTSFTDTNSNAAGPCFYRVCVQR